MEPHIERSLGLLRTHEPPQGYWGCFSGGKDSIVIKELARMAGVRVVWHYAVTTIDPPELVRFIMSQHPDVIRDQPRHGNFFARMVRRGFPTRVTRWCCQEYKETSAPVGSVMILGVRAAESPRRAKTWGDLTLHRRTRAHALSPILEWSDEQVWAFIRSTGISYCSLYDEGFHRLGCIGCPMARKAGREKEFARWPRFEMLWRRAFRQLWDRKACTKQRDGREWFGSAKFDSADELFEWWKSNDAIPATKPGRGGQMEPVGDEDESCQAALDAFSGGTDDGS